MTVIHSCSRRLSRLASSVAALALASPLMAADIAKVEWTASAQPQTPDELSAMFSTAKVKATYDDGTVTESPIGYEMVMTNRTRVGNNASPIGTIYDEAMRPIADPTDPSQPLVSEEPDGSMLTNIGGKLYLVNQFEYDWLLADGSEVRKHAGWAFKHANGKDGSWGNNLPTTMVLTEVQQDPDTGKLTPVAQRPIDFSAVGGLVWACNANTTPWGTFLSSEENYGVDARQVAADRAVDPTGRSDDLGGLTHLYHGGRTLASPYWRGITPEIRIRADGATEVTKHFAMGRGTYELAQVLGDQRTLITAHDGENRHMTMFVADRPGDLSSGTLYAAKLNQTSADKGGRFDIAWVKLGHASDGEIRALVEGGITFSDIFEVSDGPKDGFVEVYAGSSKTPEYLKVRNELAAAFLETMRYAGYKGATTEFNKAEGLAFDPEGKRAFLAITDISKGMEEGAGTGAAGDHIRLAKVKAGGVYALPLAGGQSDTDGNPIDSAFVPVSMGVPEGLLGVDLAEPDELGNTASVDHIGNADNLYWSSAYKTLFIGEDSSSMHLNNVLWAWQDGMTVPVRLLTAPAGAELTGLRIHENIGGHAYGLTNAQHVGDFDLDDNPRRAEIMEAVKARWEDRRMSPLGYVTGLPVARASAATN
ncbi:MAG: alkaline phosphatase PhoX [Pseudomonadota bacterium]